MKSITILFFFYLIALSALSQSNMQSDAIQNQFLNNSSALSTQPYRGAAIAVLPATKEDTKGSRYLFKIFIKGSIINNKDEKLDNGYLFNYDKISHQFIITQDEKSYFGVEEQNVKKYELNSEGKDLSFAKISTIGDVGYVQLLAGKEGNYCLYKAVSTKLKKANYTTNGLIESGNNYDEYVDDYAYYVVYPDAKTAEPISFKKSVIKKNLSNVEAKVEAYFSANKYTSINEGFLKGLIEVINK